MFATITYRYTALRVSVGVDSIVHVHILEDANNTPTSPDFVLLGCITYVVLEFWDSGSVRVLLTYLADVGRIFAKVCDYEYLFKYTSIRYNQIIIILQVFKYEYILIVSEYLNTNTTNMVTYSDTDTNTWTSIRMK